MNRIEEAARKLVVSVARAGNTNLASVWTEYSKRPGAAQGEEREGSGGGG